MTRAVVVVLVLALVSAPDAARAQDGARAQDEAPPPGSTTAEEQRRADDQEGHTGEADESPDGQPDIARRPVPDLDQRPEPGPDAGQILIWIPRVLLWPLHAVAEYVLRAPIGTLLSTAEHQRWDILQFPPFAEGQQSAGIVPTAFIDFGFQPSGGLYTWFDNLGLRGNALRLQAGFGGVDWLRGTVLDRITLGERGPDGGFVGVHGSIEAKVDAWMRPDHVFLGLGPYADGEHVARYGRRRLDGELAGTMRPWRSSEIRISTGISANEIYDTTYLDRGQLTMSDAVAAGFFEGISTLPSGFGGYTSYWQRMDVAIDTREGAPMNGSGVRVEAHAELAFDVLRPLDRRWILWGGAVGAFWDVDSGRTLGIWGAADFASRLGTEDVPFTEMPDAGGRGRMTGFRTGWITGASTVAVSLEYRYPIWVSIQGFVNATIGNAFGPELADFEARLLRTSYALGLRTMGDPDSSLTFQVGFGTATIEDGLDPILLRITVGMQEGF